MAKPSNQKLSDAATRVSAVKWCLVNPADAFMLTDQTISRRPAMKRSSHDAVGDRLTDMWTSVAMESRLVRHLPGAARSVRPNAQQRRRGSPSAAYGCYDNASCPRDLLRTKIHRGAITPIHVERHGGVVPYHFPSPTYLQKARRHAVPQIRLFTALAPTHSVER